MIKDNFNATIEPLLDKVPGEKLKKLAKKHKKAALLTASLPVTVPLFYFADVWSIGSLAAAIYEAYLYLTAASIFAAPEQKLAAAALKGKILPFFFFHPFNVGWAWFSKPDEALTEPGIKHLWQGLNVLGGISVGLLVWKLKGGNKKNNSKFTKGLRNVDNAAFATSRWASRNDIKHLCEFGPPVTGEISNKTGESL